jgi:hypothetical protein
MFVIANKHFAGLHQRQAPGRISTSSGEAKMEPKSGLRDPGGKLSPDSMRLTRFLRLAQAQHFRDPLA